MPTIEKVREKNVRSKEEETEIEETGKGNLECRSGEW